MPVKYVPYYPNTVEGQAILDNFVRTRRFLTYKGAGDVEERIRRGMPLYEVEEIEKVNGGGDNLLIRGECVSACAYLKEQGIKVDLVYIDPPFASGADYAKKIYLRRNPRVAEALAAGAELEDDDLKAFEEKMYGDIWNKEQYLNWMYENLVAIRSVMSETASIYVHLDWHIGHYVKILLDEIFGEDNFKNEIIWQRTSAHVGANRYGSVHDSIFFYTFSEDFVWNEVLMPYTEAYLEMFLDQIDENGERYKRTDLTGAGTTAGSSGRPWRGINPSNKGRHWTIPEKVIRELAGENVDLSKLSSQKKLDLLDQNGKIHWPKKDGGMPRLKQYRDDLEGIPPQDLLLDIRPLHNQSAERRDYDTQKPEAIVQRFIEISSHKLREDGSKTIVADFFGGSGTTAKAAQRLDRTFICSDVGLNPIQISRDELKSVGEEINILDIKDGVSLFRNPVQTMEKLKGLIVGMRNEDALDSFWEGAIEDSKLGMVPVYVPNLLDHSQKVLDKPAMRDIIVAAMPGLPDGVEKVIVYYIDIENRKELDEFIAKHNETNIKIELRDLKEVLDNVVMGDIVEYKVIKTKSGFEIEINSFTSDRLIQKIDEFNQKRELQMQKKRTKLIEIAEIGDVETEPDDGFKAIEISDNGLELIEMVSLDCTNKKDSWTSDAEIKIDKNSFVIRDGKKTKEFWNGKIVSNKKPLRLKIRNIAGDETIVQL